MIGTCNRSICAGIILLACLFASASALQAQQAKPKQAGKAKQAAKPAKQQKPAFTLLDVEGFARRLADKPYEDPRGKLTPIAAEQHRDIHFIAERAYWRADKLPFELQFFHAGSYFDRTVKINEVTPKGVAPVRFSPEYFAYERSAADIKGKLTPETGFAGFRIHGNLNTETYKDEIAVFLGASYFKAIGKGMRYGLSGRGLAVDTAQPQGEEFPWFREFWIERPAPKDDSIRVYALLDSQRLTGAYQFEIKPGEQTVMEVSSTLFLRKAVDKIGIAPMTSMFFYGENTNSRPADSYRPEVHDSDGLAIAMENGEWLWRPVCNPKTLWVNSFQADNVKGFGLLQRDTLFDHYQDLEARYDKRPSLWCTPKGSWGRGSVELVQIPTEDDLHDNIVAYWKPLSLAPGKPASFAYTLSWHIPDGLRPPGGRVVATRTETQRGSAVRTFMVEFEGGKLAEFKPADGVEGAVDIGPGARLVEQQIFKNEATGGWRLVFHVKAEENPTLAEKIMPEKKPVVEIRAFLRRGPDILTETWVCGSQL